MSDITKIRSLIQDQPLLVQEEVVFDGVMTSLRTKYFPLVGSTILLDPPNPPTVIDEQSGLLTWTSAPAAGPAVLQYAFVQLLDSTIQDYLDLQASDDAGSDDVDSIRLAAASALDAIASSQALIQKRLNILDLKTDGPAVADALRKHAVSLRSQVFDAKMNESTFDFAEQINDTAGYREKVLKDFLREDS